MKKAVNISDAPKPLAPYSQAILAGNTLYISGQIAINPYTGVLIKESVEAQTRQILENIKAILKEVEMDMSHVVKVSIFLSDMALYKKVNEVYGSYFMESPPAREAIQAAGLPMNADIVISCIAVRN
jgi:2-iminobutanoate/2-iminopropanoate deaminase